MDGGRQSRRTLITAAMGSGALVAVVPNQARAAEEIHDDLFVRGSLYLIRNKRPDVAPELHFVGQRGQWLIGSDVANNGGGGRDFVLAAKVNHHANGSSTVTDLIYLTPGPEGVRVGVGRTPPDAGFRLEVGGQGSDGSLAVVHGQGCTGDAFAIFDAAGRKQFSIDSQFRIHAPEIDELRERVKTLEARLGQETDRRRRKDKRLRRGLKRLRKRIGG
jgi:hypothetical protein